MNTNKIKQPDLKIRPQNQFYIVLFHLDFIFLMKIAVKLKNTKQNFIFVI